MKNVDCILDRYLGYWEGYCFGHELSHFCQGIADDVIEPALSNMRHFRQYLLSNTDGLDAEQFMLDHAGGRKDLPIFKGGEHLTPFEILSWTNSSRRIYNIGHEMQNAFQNISINGMSANKIVWPFDSFGIQLANPIKGDGCIYDFLLVSRPGKYLPSRVATTKFGSYEEPADLICIRAISTTYRKAPVISEDKRNRLIRAMNKGSVEKVRSFVESYADEVKSKLPNKGYSIMIPYPFESSPEPMEEVIRRVRGDTSQSDDAMGLFTKIVCNLCLYLEALSSSATYSSSGYEWVKTPKRRGEKADTIITDQARVCEVSSMHTLRSLEGSGGKRESAESGYEMIPHWRRKHYRRKPGEGNNPDAPRDVKVPPTLVRADLLPKYGLPQGAVSVVR